MKNLIIVESPTKAKTIKHFLGQDYTIIASKGHVRDLPKSSFGIKIENNEFIPEYRVSKDHSSILKEMKDIAKKSDNIYIATDEDREGEAIGYHVAVALGKDPLSLPRIVFHEITKNAVLNSLQSPRKLDMHSINAQQARRLLDRIVGYKLSPLLSSKIQKGLSGGRVQSSALKIVVDKEREIKAFISQEYWSIDALFNKNIEAALVEFQKEKIEKLTITNKQKADEIYETLVEKEYKVLQIETKERKTQPQPPFMTSTLQQTASSNLGFSPKKTMMLAQTLYEGVNTNHGISGVITYMRTDSLNIAKEAIDSARDAIKNNFGKDYLPKTPNIYTTKSKGAQEAHEAIRPTLLDFTPEVAKAHLKPDELKLYTLIYNRFLASQMTPAIIESQVVLIGNEDGVFKANGRRMIFDGFYRLSDDKDKDSLLPKLEIGELVKLNKLEANQHFTEPPSRYSEASLIKKLESLGIGRPSTYAPTISLLESRKYISIEKKQILPTEIAFKVIEILEVNFAEIVDVGFTSSMEETLDLIAENKKDWQSVLADFYTPFIKQIEAGKTNIQSQKVTIKLGESCPECGNELVQRKGRFGDFVACSSYPKCKYTKNLTQRIKQEPKVIEGVVCPDCGGNIIERSSRRGKFFGCSNYPKCKFISSHEPTTLKCPECNAPMAKKTLKKEEILECTKCKHKM